MIISLVMKNKIWKWLNRFISINIRPSLISLSDIKQKPKPWSQCRILGQRKSHRKRRSWSCLLHLQQVEVEVGVFDPKTQTWEIIQKPPDENNLLFLSLSEVKFRKYTLFAWKLNFVPAWLPVLFISLTAIELYVVSRSIKVSFRSSFSYSFYEWIYNTICRILLIFHRWRQSLWDIITVTDLCFFGVEL